MSPTSAPQTLTPWLEPVQASARLSPDGVMARPEWRGTIESSMTVLDVSDTSLDAISPELILVSPPEIAQFARARLPVFPKPVRIDPKAEGHTSPRTIELIAAYLFCLLVTLGPLGFIILADPIHPA